MGGRSGGTQASPLQQARVVNQQEPIFKRIQAAYYDISRENNNEWVSLAALRARIGYEFSRQQLDDALIKFEQLHRNNVLLVEEHNQKALTQIDRAAELFIGGGPVHVLKIVRRVEFPER